MPHGNLAILYLDQSSMKDAKREIDAALAVDPSFDIALLARAATTCRPASATRRWRTCLPPAPPIRLIRNHS